MFVYWSDSFGYLSSPGTEKHDTIQAIPRVLLHFELREDLSFFRFQHNVSLDLTPPLVF